jgi:hypothetical protein
VRAAWIRRNLIPFFTLPFRDVLRGLDAVLAAGPKAFLRMMVGLGLGWWLYVPLHEILHAAGCWLAGGRVERLEVAPLYFGSLLAYLFPWVEAGGDYAGRLAAFETGGSDFVYLVTVLAPYILTLFPGVPWFYRAIRRARPFSFGASLPMALAPFLAVTGDAYEASAILITRLPPWTAGSVAQRIRGEDLFLRWYDLAQGASLPTWTGFAVTTLTALLAAWAVYALASRLAMALTRHDR